MKSYPAQLSLTTLICLMGALEGAIVTLIIEHSNASIWVIPKGPTLCAVLYGVSHFHNIRFFHQFFQIEFPRKEKLAQKYHLLKEHLGKGIQNFEYFVNMKWVVKTLLAIRTDCNIYFWEDFFQ